MYKWLSNHSTAIKFIIFTAVVGLGLYIEWGGSTLSQPSADTPESDSSRKDSTISKSLSWENDSIVPTTIESYDNGTYSMTLNDSLRVKFIRLDDPESIEWPEEFRHEKSAVTLRSDTLSKKLAKALGDDSSGQTDRELRLTNVSLTSVNDPDVITGASLTFNETLTINGVSLMEGNEGPWLAWPSRRYQGEWVNLVESGDNLKNDIVLRIQQKLGTQEESADRSTSAGSLPRFPAPENGIRAEVIRVYDGDTIKADLMDGTDREVVVRIEGIDCPESSRNDKCESTEYREGMSCAEEIKYGKRASRIAKRWLSGQQIILVPSGEEEGFEKGYYDRWLAYIRLNSGVDYGLKMVNEGYCKDTSESFSHQRGETYRRYEAPLKPLQ